MDSILLQEQRGTCSVQCTFINVLNVQEEEELRKEENSKITHIVTDLCIGRIATAVLN